MKPHHLLSESKEFIKHRCMIQDVQESSFLRFIILLFVYDYSPLYMGPCAHFCPSVCMTGTLFLHIWILLIKRESDWSAPLSRVMCQLLVPSAKTPQEVPLSTHTGHRSPSLWCWLGRGLGSSPAGK